MRLLRPVRAARHQFRDKPRGIDKRDDRASKFFGDFHDAQGLAVAFRFWHTEVPILPLLGVSTLLMTDQAYRDCSQSTKTGHDGSVISKLPIPMDFNEIRAKLLHVIQEVRTLRMPCELYLWYAVRWSIFVVAGFSPP